MPSAIAWLLLIVAQALLAGQGLVEAKRFFGVGQRIDGDQLLLKDVQHSRPAGSSEPASVAFNYNIAEPITYIEIISEENISAEVKFSYTDSLVVGVVRLLGNNVSDFEPEGIVQIDDDVVPDVDGEETPLRIVSAPFDVLITIFGFNQTMLNMNPALLLNRDGHFEGELMPYDDDDEDEIAEISELYDNIQRDDLQVNIDAQATEGPIFAADRELQDKIIDIGERQDGDDLVFETYQTSGDVSKEQTNHTVTFYFIDSVYITYIKFVIYDHISYKAATAEDYLAPVAEYSHYTPFTLKATISTFNDSSLFVQMFVYGYRGLDAVPASYKPFLERPTQQLTDDRTPSLTPLQRMQLLLMTGRSTTPSPLAEGESDSEDDDDNGGVKEMRPEEMEFIRQPETSVPNAVLEQQRAVPQRLYAMLGLMLFAVA